MLLVIRNWKACALGTRIDAREKMATGKRAHPTEGFYHGVTENVRLKAKKVRQKKTERVDQENMYPIGVSSLLFDRIFKSLRCRHLSTC